MICTSITKFLQKLFQGILILRLNYLVQKKGHFYEFADGYFFAL